MPSPSLFGKRMEISERTLVRRASSPILERVQPASPLVHRGLMFADGTPYKGGKGHSSTTPRDHPVLNPPPADKFYTEPVAFLPGGQPVMLGKRPMGPNNSGTSTPVRSTSPAASHVSGRRHATPTATSRDSPIRHDYRSTASPSRIHQKPGASHPKDHYITGVCERPDTVDTKVSTIVRGVRHLDGCPTFVPPSFDKRPYTPQTKRVASKYADNDIFNAYPAEQHQTPPRSLTPRRITPSSTSSVLQTAAVAAPPSGTVIRRAGGSEAAVTPSRTTPAAPYSYTTPASTSVSVTPQRSRTPSRASPGSTGYNIITGKAYI
ncbi:Hypothetical protein, putative [Bodo saltans]|uniref:Uncharacterized protein n=1 Tax=Bodo saltans TaxID=75058 RepID=A0A0S4ITU1_BODSA|nr:Hypothetical protein, putative [Bodo saltans]|eukprot:CUF83383.1 Hypothetical protein, putative [Bodo saltans]